LTAKDTIRAKSTLAALKMGDTLKAAGLDVLPLLLGVVLVVAMLELIMRGP
jgi:p-aminobenzoyl-glutamate transporter AbgT